MFNSGELVQIIKCNTQGEEVYRYAGTVLEHSGECVFVEAFFNRDDLRSHGMVLARDDRFLEMYYSQRWYNIFEIHSKVDGSLKGWYCNVTRPAVFGDGVISYVDLALDLLVFPDGRQLVLDEDEFAVLRISDDEKEIARNALHNLQSIFVDTAGFHL
jgi:uncharacterized protein